MRTSVMLDGKTVDFQHHVAGSDPRVVRRAPRDDELHPSLSHNEPHRRPRCHAGGQSQLAGCRVQKKKHAARSLGGAID